MYVFVTYAADLYLRGGTSLGAGTGAAYTTFFAPLNPFLALEALLAANTYVPRGAETLTNPISVAWYAYPTATFCWISILSSFAMVLWSTLRVRSFGRAPGSASWWSKLFGVGMTGGEREAVIEAMKMENVLFAQADGVVSKVMAAQGESLTVDQPIVEFAA